MRKKIITGTLFIAGLCLIASVLLAPAVPVSDSTQVGVEIHVDMWHYRDDVLLQHSHHPGVLTTLGANWIEDQMGDSPATDPAKWIAVSNNSSTPAAAWIVIPNEITTGNMGRAAGTYASTGDGEWTITETFSPSGSGSCQLTGLYWAATGDLLLCADTFTTINFENGDTIEIQWAMTVS